MVQRKAVIDMMSWLKITSHTMFVVSCRNNSIF